MRPRAGCVCSNIYSGSLVDKRRHEKKFKERPIHPIVGRQRRLGTVTRSGSLQSQTSPKNSDHSPSETWFRGVGAFVGAGRRSLALSERSELASDGRATEKATHGAFVGGVRAIVTLPVLPVGMPCHLAALRTSRTRSAGPPPQSLSFSSRCFSPKSGKRTSNVHIYLLNAKRFL